MQQIKCHEDNCQNYELKLRGHGSICVDITITDCLKYRHL